MLPLPTTPRMLASRSGSTASSQASSSLAPHDLHVHHTDSIRALLDVELAVDQGSLAEAMRSAASRPRRISTIPRVSELENPFIDLAPRLGSRRIRPMVIELIQALAHYVDAVWCVTHPGKRCPWVAEEGEAASGHVNAQPVERDVRFWAEEVRFALREVDEVVGICKGVGWAFDAGISRGEYGEVEVANVLGDDGRGGSLARLLNDLEEAIW